MNVTLIAAPIMDFRRRRLCAIAQDEGRNCPPYGIYLLTSILRQRGHNVTVLDLIARGTRNLHPFADEIAKAEVVGIGATSLSWPTALDVVRQLRRLRPEVPIVLGGIHPTMFDKYLLQRFPVDYVIRGEAELALPDLCEAIGGRLDITKVPNLSWKTPDGRFIRNKLAPKIAPTDLGRFPLPAYDDLPAGAYKGIAIESSRGCAFDCSFCSTSYRKSWRGLEPGIFADRLEQLLPYAARTVFRSVHIVDDEFSTNPRRAMAIAELLRHKGLKPALVYDSRANDLLYDGYVETMAEYTYHFLVGAECGYDDGLKLIGKGTTCERLEAAARKLHDNGLAGRADFSFILGLPWESRREVERTIEFAVHLYGEYGVRILLQWYCLIPGSRLWEEARDRALVTEAMYDEYGFFRNLHFWCNSVRLSPEEAWEIEDMIRQLQWLAGVADPKKHMIQNAIPTPLAMYFPRNVLASDTPRSDGLASLREVSLPRLDGRAVVTQCHTDTTKEKIICQKLTS